MLCLLYSGVRTDPPQIHTKVISKIYFHYEKPVNAIMFECLTYVVVITIW